MCLPSHWFLGQSITGHVFSSLSRGSIRKCKLLFALNIAFQPEFPLDMCLFFLLSRMWLFFLRGIQRVSVRKSKLSLLPFLRPLRVFFSGGHVRDPRSPELADLCASPGHRIGSIDRSIESGAARWVVGRPFGKPGPSS